MHDVVAEESAEIRPSAYAASPAKRAIQSWTEKDLQYAAKQRLIEACRLAAQWFHFSLVSLGSTHGKKGWQLIASRDPEDQAPVRRLRSFVMVSKRLFVTGLEIDGLDAFVQDLGFKVSWLGGTYRTRTPGGGDRSIARGGGSSCLKRLPTADPPRKKQDGLPGGNSGWRGVVGKRQLER
jgi:hypothetical protein